MGRVLLHFVVAVTLQPCDLILLAYVAWKWLEDSTPDL